METKELRNAVIDLLVDNKFQKKKDFLYKKDSNLIYVIGLQKAKHSKGFFINVGYIIKDLYDSNIYPKDVDGHIRTRFSYQFSNDSKKDLFDTTNFPSNNAKLRNVIKENIESLIISVEQKGIHWLLETNPILLYQTTLNARSYLAKSKKK